MRSRSTTCYVTVRPGWRSAQFGLLSRVLAAPGRLCRWKRSLPPLLRTLPRLRIAEVSRFSRCPSNCVRSVRPGSLARLALVRGIVQLSASIETHPLVRADGTKAVGGCWAHPVSTSCPWRDWLSITGFASPLVVGTSRDAGTGYREKPAVWEFITDGGMFWRAGRRLTRHRRARPIRIDDERLPCGLGARPLVEAASGIMQHKAMVGRWLASFLGFPCSN